MSIPQQQRLSPGSHQLFHHPRVNALLLQLLTRLLPIRILQTAQPGSDRGRQLLDPRQPFLRRFLSVHQLEEPGAVHLKRPKPAEQLLTLILLRQRKARNRRLAHHIAAGGGSTALRGISGEQEPTDGRSHKRRESKRNHHGPKPALSSLLTGYGRVSDCLLRGF